MHARMRDRDTVVIMTVMSISLCTQHIYTILIVTITTVADIIISSESSHHDRCRGFHHFISIGLCTQHWLLVGGGKWGRVDHTHIHRGGVVSKFIHLVPVISNHIIHIFIGVACLGASPYHCMVRDYCGS